MLKVDKIIQLLGIVLRFLVGLSGSEDILGKKRALTDLSPKVHITSLNSHFTSENLSTRWRGRSKRGRVWIKVCNMKFPTDLVGPHLISLM